MDQGPSRKKAPRWRWWSVTFFALFGLVLLAALYGWAAENWVPLQIALAVYILFMLGWLAVYALMGMGKGTVDAIKEIERDADARYGPSSSAGARQDAGLATVAPITDEGREAARRAYVSTRLTFLFMGLGFFVVAGLAGLIFGFWLLAYAGGGLLLLLLVVALASGGLFGG